ncbi:hypothetical protein ACHAXS_009623 [Conticribra weissflogii]
MVIEKPRETTDRAEKLPSETGRKRRSDSTSTATSEKSAATLTSNESYQSNGPKPSKSTHTNSRTFADDAGSSRLFQPHRSLGLLTAACAQNAIGAVRNSLSTNLFQAQMGKFHLQHQAASSDETFVTVPLGDRFQIVTVSKLVPVLVSRTLPPSKQYYREQKKENKNHVKNIQGGDEEEMHQVISDSSLSISVATHGPKSLGRAVSITLFERTRPIQQLDAFPFLAPEKKNNKNKRRLHGWGIVDVVHLGKQKVVMHGEKEGKVENVMLLAMICARSDSQRFDQANEQFSGADVEVFGKDSDDSEDDEYGDENDNDENGSLSSKGSNGIQSCSNRGSSSSDDDSEDEDVLPTSDCYGRVLIVQASRKSMNIVKIVDLNGIGSHFIPHVGMHPATYVNKIILGGRPTSASREAHQSKGSVFPASLLLLNVRTGKMIHSFQCLFNKKGKKKRSTLNYEENYPTITSLEQSPAVDTIAVGTSDGSVHLINTLHDVKLFSLHHKSKIANMANAVSSISFRTDGNATRQGVAPVAVGCDDGSITVWDLTPADEDNQDGTPRRTLLTHMDGTHYGGVSKLEYLPGEPLLLSTGLVSNSILLHVFDAPDHSGRILRQRKGHTSPPQLLRYLHPGIGGGGILANASDGTDASSCQILSCGGSGDRTLRLFSTARSNLDKEFSQGPGLDRKAKKLGKLGPEGRAELLLPEVVALANCEARSRDWGDLVTIHRNHAMAYVWNTKRGSQSGPVLRQSHWNISAMKERPPRSANATSVAISACGNFALVGTLGGVVYKYNLQSGLPRGSFPRDATTKTAEEERQRQRGLKFAGDVGRTMRILEKNAMKGGMMTSDMDQAERERISYVETEAKRKAMIEKASHDGAVVGIAIDSLNKTIVTAGADSKLVLWSFTSHMPHKKSPIMLPSPATKMCHVRDSDLAAIALADFGVVVFDCSSLSIVRYFGGSRSNESSEENKMGHTGPISDLGFGPDGRKLFTSSYDGSIRVWDVPTGICVDWSKFDIISQPDPYLAPTSSQLFLCCMAVTFSSPPSSLTLSPTGEFLATSHVGRLGISLWCDKSFFRMVLLDGTPTEPCNMNEPCPVAECEQENANMDVSTYHCTPWEKKNESKTGVFNAENKEGSKVPPAAKKEGLITLSGLPPGHWKNLFHLELVKERNKPKAAPEKPPQAPFFLQWRSGIESETVDGEDPEGENSTGKKETPSNNDGWDAVWSDDDADGNSEDGERYDETKLDSTKDSSQQKKRRKVVHHRSKLADLLQTCFDATDKAESSEVFSEWLLEACESNRSFEAVNAYLHRFLHVHGNVITRIAEVVQNEDGNENDEHLKQKLREFVDIVAKLRENQRAAANRLSEKMQHTICLLRHLSRMV